MDNSNKFSTSCDSTLTAQVNRRTKIPSTTNLFSTNYREKTSSESDGENFIESNSHSDPKAPTKCPDTNNSSQSTEEPVLPQEKSKSKHKSPRGCNTLSCITEIEDVCAEYSSKTPKPEKNSRRQTVLEEIFDPTYGVTEEEVLEFAKLHGICPVEEPELVAAARTVLLTPLPPPWQAVFDEGAQAVYYHNPTTDHSSWLHPLDADLREAVRRGRDRGEL
ncbi:uncharacterized protein LOC125177819 [Hyalella azteca]|uniref:Uncharacterized protein LOC125177819 n=1 Tax=Hyalella azteca TaxID=294128 RepID=A0A979FI30_HYAAZ|nr:uncharacterized protein LOC125177819 [Hyalella azteca]